MIATPRLATRYRPPSGLSRMAAIRKSIRRPGRQKWGRQLPLPAPRLTAAISRSSPESCQSAVGPIPAVGTGSTFAIPISAVPRWNLSVCSRPVNVRPGSDGWHGPGRGCYRTFPWQCLQNQIPITHGGASSANQEPMPCESNSLAQKQRILN